jgi:hypothetical protein
LPLVEAEGLNKCEEFVFRVPSGGKGHRKGKAKTANKGQAQSQLKIDQDL